MKKYILMALFLMIIGSVSADITDIQQYLSNGLVNSSGGSRFLDYSATYTWGINISGTNITSVKVGDLEVHLNANSSLDGGNGTYYATGTPPEVADFYVNCSFITINATIYSKNASGSRVVNVSSQNANPINNLTVVPCFVSGYASNSTNVGATATTLSLQFPSGNTTNVTTTARVWLPMAQYNSTAKYCPYTVLNATKAISYNMTPTPTSDIDFCEVDVVHSTSDPTDVTVYQSASMIAITPPYSILPSTAGVVATLVVFTIGAAAGYNYKKRIYEAK